MWAKRTLVNSKHALACVGLAGLIAQVAACSSAPKTKVELDQLLGKKIALLEIQGDDSSKRVVETALVNQLSQSGDFEIVSKQDVDAVRKNPSIDPRNLLEIASQAGADFSLRIRVEKFQAAESTGYNEEEEHDSQLEEETGSGVTKRLVKVRALRGEVSLYFELTDVKSKEQRTGTTTVTENKTAEGKDSAPRLPPRLRFLEKLSQQAISKFFKESR